VWVNKIFSEFKPINVEISQGSASLLFNILLFDLPSNENTNLALYADDSVIYWKKESNIYKN
jgi:hypothetical protein